MSGYRFLLNVCSNSCNCCDVKCVRWRRCRLFFLSFFVSSLATICSSCITKFVFSTLTFVSFIDRLPAIYSVNEIERKISSNDPGWMLMRERIYLHSFDLYSYFWYWMMIENAIEWCPNCLRRLSSMCGCCHGNHQFRPILKSMLKLGKNSE